MLLLLCLLVRRVHAVRIRGMSQTEVYMIKESVPSVGGRDRELFGVGSIGRDILSSASLD